MQGHPTRHLLGSRMRIALAYGWPAVLGLGIVTGCEWRLTHHEDIDPGSACVEPDAAAGEPLEVVIAYTCFSGSTRNMDATCEVGVDTVANVIQVSARFVYDLPGDVTADCNDITATCVSSGPVPAGRYVLRYGDEVMTVELGRGEAGDGLTCTSFERAAT